MAFSHRNVSFANIGDYWQGNPVTWQIFTGRVAGFFRAGGRMQTEYAVLLPRDKPAQNDCTFAERFIPAQNFSSKNLHPVSILSAFAKSNTIY